jgi:putative ABC transport system permease protein
MAWRNVWRNRRRSLVTVGAMAFSLFAMVIYSGLLNGYLANMERSVVDVEVGDIEIFNPVYRDKPSLHERIADPERVVAALDAAGLIASPRLLAFGLAAGKEASTGASFRGVVPDVDARVSRVHAEVAEGSWLDPATPKGVVVGRRLARSLGLGVGDEMLVFSEATDGDLAYDLFDVRGILRAIGDATDRTAVFMVDGAFRRLFEVESGAHQILVRRPEGLPLAVAAARARAAAPGLDVATWRELMPTVASMLDSTRGLIVAIFVIAYLAVALLVLNATLMAVFERVREFGILKAIGVEPAQVFALLVAESAIQTGLAVAVGLALVTPVLVYLARVGIDVASLAGVSVMGIAMERYWRATLSASTVAAPVAVLVLLVGIAVVYPAAKAALIRPVDAIRHH